MAMGASAAAVNQQSNAVAIGHNAGYTRQQSNAISIGNTAGVNTQNLNAIASGASAAYMNLGRYQEAITDYDSAHNIAPDLAVTYHNRGLANYKSTR